MKISCDLRFKKIFSVLCICILFLGFSLTSIPVSAATETTVSYSITGDGIVGSTVEIAANVSSASNLYGVSWDFIYDTSMLQIQSISAGPLMGTNISKFTSNANGRAYISMSKFTTASPVNGEGTLAIIRARVLKVGTIKINTTPTTSNLNISNLTSCIKLSDDYSNKIAYSYKDSSIITKPISSLTDGKYENTNGNLTYTDNWIKATDSSQHFSNVLDNEVSFSFEGTGVNIHSITANNRGIAKVYIDGIAYDADDYTETVQRKVIFSKTDLPIGKHEVRIVVTNNKNAASTGYYISIDAIEILCNPPVLKSGKYQNTDSNLFYAGSWVQVTDGSQRYSKIENSTLYFSFEGTGFNLTSLVASNRGIAKIYVDGTAYDIDTYSPTVTSKIIFAKDGLPFGKHDVKVVVTNTKNATSTDTYISIAAIEILISPPVLTTGKYENTNSNLIYTGSWVQVADGSQRYSNIVDSAFQFSFEGTGFNLNSLVANNRGIAKVYIDGTSYDVDTYSDVVQRKTIFSKDGLAMGKHTVKVVITNTKNAASSNYYISITSIEILNSSPVLASGMYENTSSDIAYTGSWVKVTDGSQNYSKIENSALYFSFQGTGFNLHSIVANNRGIAKVYVDGVAYDVDTYSPTVERKIVFTKDGLAYGKHNVKILVTNTKNTTSTDTYISIDAVEILVTPPTLSSGKYDNFDPNLIYTGSWTSVAYDSQHFSKTENSTVSFSFEGTGFNLHSLVASNRGIAKLYVDGVAYDVDTYSPTIERKIVFTKDGLTYGKHNVQIVVTCTKNTISTDTYISIDAVEII
ncbi:cohesin domain-containing protein [Clostridium cellulovorans]|uniref:Cellulosome anchoring protein cohesin region n=1 Tax=Clostridium cellulovorans (strain ATCC 35296 / DSM 3052 / OCM 3 / 743B) TaxID=573061 RepID=D9SR53_CLOC7|nr:cohesin domain-containing protein [Clostridium cellulovorans]ADL50341.1 cellulosome anchoring protein cohesin region [Clostridium cellulovorans 743B]